MTELGVRTIPGYVVHERLETSLVGATYLASRVSDGYPVLLQIVSGDHGGAVDASSLRTAIDAVAGIRHPVIPTIREVGEADGMPYTISNAVEGRSLASTLATRPRLPHDQTLAMCTELADALEILASAGVVHGAISPCTVWVNDRSRSPSAPYVSLHGFGAAAVLAHRLRAERQRPPPPDVLYVAPEQIAGREPSDRTDQYALACMTLHCLTGAPPFERTTIDALFDAKRSAAADDSVLHAVQLPHRIVDGLRRALATDPADRFDSSMSFALAIGGPAHRSWSWMIEDTSAPDSAEPHSGAPREIDIRDDVGPTAASGGRSPRTPTDERGTVIGAEEPPLTARSLAEVDWLPASATRTGPQRPVKPPRSHGTDDRSAAPGRGRARRRRSLGVGLVVVVIAAVAAAVALTRAAPQRTTAAPEVAVQPTGASALEIEAAWRRPVADGPLTHLVPADDGLLGATRDSVTSLNPETGLGRWRTVVDAAVTDVTTVGPTAIVTTANGLTALDRANGDVVWRSEDTALSDVDDVATGRGRMFAAVSDRSGRLTVHAMDPRTGEIGWSIAGQSTRTADRPAAIAFDGSERGGRSLYVAHADQLYSFDTITRRLRWTVALPDVRPASLTAIGGAIVAVDEDGLLCRYDARDGGLAWSECATLERPNTPLSIVQVRNRRVVVAGSNEIMSVDFTSGRTLWRIVSDLQMQPAIASNRSATFIAAPDGTVEALAQRNGASLWESAPFGGITAMTATERTVFVATDDGRLTRLETPPETDQR